MARRPPPPGSNVVPPPQTRQNEYFVPKDGIDREVITADICRYLGNNALVRPGNYVNPNSGEVIPGYYINAYRNLTSAMIQDLKADSARWDAERRQQSANRNTGGGTTASNGVFVRSSDTLAAQYRDSGIHQARQYNGPTDSGYSTGNSGGDPFDNGPRYPGTGSSGYAGAASSYPQQYGASSGGYMQQGYPPNSGQFAPPSGAAPYGSGHSVATAGYGQVAQDPPYNIVGANLRAGSQSQDPYGNDHYGASRDPMGDPGDQRIPVTSAMQSNRPTYTTSGPSPVSGYPTPGPNTDYYPPNATSGSGSYSQPAPVQPGEPYYGLARSDCLASSGGNATYSEQQYETTPAHERMSGSSQNTQPSASGPGRHRERDSVERHVDRHPDSRHTHRSHRPTR
ncbi:hypothetical protein GGR50DRAFT_705357 [Xylaria sp. CBS 124048]|nr:hypothetical protein GGR50DRAFT_705357 [Xylaria sp. CBS 124048]